MSPDKYKPGAAWIIDGKIAKPRIGQVYRVIAKDGDYQAKLMALYDTPASGSFELVETGEAPPRGGGYNFTSMKRQQSQVFTIKATDCQLVTS